MEEPSPTTTHPTAANNSNNRRRNNRSTSEGQSSVLDREGENHGRGNNPSRRGRRRDHTPQSNYTVVSSTQVTPGDPKPVDAGDPSGSFSQDSVATAGRPKSIPKAQPNRRRNVPRFNANLTHSSTATPHDTKEPKKYHVSSQKDDLTSRLIHDLRTHPYPDCAICFNSIHPAQPTWSCSPSSFTAVADRESSAAGSEGTQSCWTTFHLKCIRSWASKSIKEVTDALRARGEERNGEWFCPACRAKRVLIPSEYKCFCGSTVDPKPPRLATPHSCGSPCSRARECEHPCPIPCHPGPCPPCHVTRQLRCHCSSKVLSFKCSNLTAMKNNPVIAVDLSCGNICSRRLECGNHTCQNVCHPGDCEPCEVRRKARCYCGKEHNDIRCGTGEPKQCEVKNEGRWLGLSKCDNICARALDCGLHQCSKPCHPPSIEPAPCALSPSQVTSCPCGKHPLAPSEAPNFPKESILTRTLCSDPIPTCTSICSKQLSGCSHGCSTRCHTGPCPPCSINVVRRCRCGATTRDIQCYDNQSGSLDEIFCDRTCSTLRACGRHQCNRICCPLAFLAGATKGKGRKHAPEGAIVDEHGWHTCDLTCGKPLACGNHQCAEMDHKGPCPPCLQSTFEEIFCYCGKTTLEPPVPCGVRVSCRYPCDRPLFHCGHPKSQHVCHEDPTPCPPCPFLTSKKCGCGKKSVDNVRCSQDKVSCGTPCGKLMRCGFHRCERLCHSDECGQCQTSCGKPRKLCLPAHHACTTMCHAPSACPEIEPCLAIINLSCPCGRIRQPVPCGRSTSYPGGHEGSQQLKCSNECGIAKRNARLAEALGIAPENRIDTKKVTYSNELLTFARSNPKFSTMAEKSLADFVSSDKKNQVLPHMPENRRQFVQELAAVYRIDTQVIDQEPHRSVQLRRRIDSRVPSPLLSAAAIVSASTNLPALGKLADLRSQSRSTPSAPLPKLAAPTASPNRWTSPLTRPERALPANTASSTPPRSTTPSSVIRAPTPRRDHVPPPHSDPVPDSWEEDA